MPSPKRRTHAASLFLACAVLLPSLALANFSVTLNAQYSRVLDQDKANALGHWNGLGGTLFLEFQPVDFFSLGGALNFTPYFGVAQAAADPSFSAYADGVVRILPLGMRGKFSPYLLGTFGWNPNSVLNLSGWNGNYHAQAGLGFYWFADAQSAMDLGFTYNVFSPETNLLKAASAHVGLAFFVDPTPLAQANRRRPVPRFDSLQAVAAREYGDPDLYPILVDANFKSEARGFTWKPGTPLTIPKPLTPAMIKEALAKARDPLYVQAASTFHDPMLSEEYRKASRASGSYWLPVTSKRRSVISFHAESLWDVAARADVYGDPELYPLLVDANRVRLQRSFPSKAFNLIIPKPTKDLSDKARLKAWSVEYGIWRGKDVTQKEYKDWKDKHGRWVAP